MPNFDSIGLYGAYIPLSIVSFGELFLPGCVEEPQYCVKTNIPALMAAPAKKN